MVMLSNVALTFYQMTCSPIPLWIS